jgi:protease-4
LAGEDVSGKLPFMSEKKSGCFLGFLVIGLIVSLITNMVLVAGYFGKSVMTSSTVPNFEEHSVEPAGSEWASGSSKIVEIQLNGVISRGDPDGDGSGLEELEWKLRKAREDASVGAVLLRIDSPGGEVTASDVLFEAVRQTREKKPVVVSMESVAASGGYYVACGASYITAYDTTITASIGVILQSLNYKELASKMGLQVQTFKSGSMKDLLNGARDLTEEERRYVQGLIDQSYDRFVGIVARERHLDESALRKGVADGRIMSGTDALKEKLVDSVGGWPDALAKARELAKSPGAPVFRYDHPFHFGKLSRFLSQSHLPSQVRVDWNAPLGKQLPQGRLLYMNPLLIP